MMLLNQIVIAAKVAAEPKSKTLESGNIVTTVSLSVAQNKKVKGEWEHQHYTIEAEGWNKTAEKLQKMTIGQRGVFIGKLAGNLFEYNGKPCQKLYLDVLAIEPVDKPAATSPPPPSPPPRAPKQTEIEEPVTEDDVPF